VEEQRPHTLSGPRVGCLRLLAISNAASTRLSDWQPPLEVTIYGRRRVGGYSYRAGSVVNTYNRQNPPPQVRQSTAGSSLIPLWVRRAGNFRTCIERRLMARRPRRISTLQLHAVRRGDPGVGPNAQLHPRIRRARQHDDGASASASDICAALQVWCTHDVEVPSQKRLGLYLAGLGFRKWKRNGKAHYQHVRLKGA
jgi:hypothetical protein